MPTIGSPEALTTESIRWNLTDNSSTETGFKVYDTSNVLKATCATTDLTYCDETGLSINTTYTRKVVAYNSSGNSNYSSNASKYTLSTVPNAPAVNNAGLTTLDINPDPNSSPTSTEMVAYKETGASCDGSGGSYIAVNGSDNGSTPVWQAESSWATVTATGLSENTQYSFCTKSRNGDNIETSWGSTASGTTTESIAPSISSITSIAGDTASTYYDLTDDSSTEIIFVSTDGAGGGVSSCKWDSSDTDYDSMANACASTSSCTTDLSGDGVKTIYLRCQDIYNNKMASSESVSYTIDTVAPTTLSATGSSASWTNAKPAVTVSTPVDATSGMKEIRYVWDSNNLGVDCSAGTVITATANLTGTLTAGSHILYLCASDNAGNVTTWNGTYKWDNGNPLVNITTHVATIYKAADIPAKIEGTASDAISAVASVAVSIYNGTMYYSGAAFDSVPQAWLAVTGTDTWEYAFAPTTDGDYTLQSRSTDSATNQTLSSTTLFTYDSLSPVISVAESVSVNTTGGTITWTTNEISSSQIQYGINTSYGNTTTETNTSPRVTAHSVAITGLASCITYHYRVVSTDTAGNTLIGNDKTFTTTGCVGSSTVEAQTDNTITTLGGGIVQLQETGITKVSLTVPINFGATDADFQVKKLDKASVILATLIPVTTRQVIGDHVYQLDALTSITNRVSSFDQSLNIVMSYTDEEVLGFDESNLSIYRWDDSNWYELDSCVVDRVANTISCNTTAFSTFALFLKSSIGGTSTSVSTGESSQVCSGLAPSVKPPWIYGVIPVNSTSLKLYFTDADKPVKDYVLVYGTKPDEYLYGSQNIGGYGQRTFIVDHLKPSTNYYFKIMAVNDCYLPGPWSNVAKGKTISKIKSYSNNILGISTQKSIQDNDLPKVKEEVKSVKKEDAKTEEKPVDSSIFSKVKDVYSRVFGFFGR